MRAIELCAVTFPLAATVLSAIPAASQTPQSALVNQRSRGNPGGGPGCVSAYA